MSIISVFILGICLGIVNYSQLCSSAAITTRGPVEKSCSESNITIDEVQFRHIWDLNGLALYMTRLDQWKPFIDLETKDVRFKNGVIGGIWNFQIVRNHGTGSRLTLCAVHTPEHRKPNPHDKNFFFEFKVLVTLVPPPVPEINETQSQPQLSTTTTSIPTSTPIPTSIPTTTPESISSSSLPTSTEIPEPEPSSTSSTTPSTTTSTNPTAEDNSNSNSIIRRSLGLGLGGISRHFNGTKSGSSAFAPIVLQFGSGSASGSPFPDHFSLKHINHRLNPAKESSASSFNVSLSSPTFQQSPVSPKTHFTFWDFETKTLGLIRNKYKSEPPPKGTQLILTFTMTEYILEKPETVKKACV